MGGRGSSSASGGKRKLTGSLEESKQRLEALGLKFGNSSNEARLDALGPEYVKEIADTLEVLEGRYGVIGYINQYREGYGTLDDSRLMLSVKSGGDAYAWVEGFKETGSITTLGVDSRRSHEAVQKSYQSSMETNFHPRSTIGAVPSIITHEYGHMLQWSMMRSSGGRYAGKHAASEKRKIMDIAKKKYGATKNDSSRYGLKNSMEFFAEAFASAHGGSPNAVGLAMQDYLAEFKGF